MKVFRKMFAFAVTVAAIAMATSAFAATAEYDSSNTLVKVSDVSELTESVQMTVAVVPENFGEASVDDDIYYIDQDEAATIISNLQEGLAIKEALQNPASYQVRVAGTSMGLKTFEFPEIQEDPEYTYINGANGELGIKGSFQLFDGGKVVVITLIDSKNNNAEGTLTWDLSNITNVTSPITFGLEIKPDVEGRDMSGISIVDVSYQQN